LFGGSHPLGLQPHKLHRIVVVVVVAAAAAAVVALLSCLVKRDFFSGCLTPEDGTDRLSRNVGKQLQTYAG
jgi:hypothetical protein